MGFTIDWGTLVVSVPVVAAATVGTIKFIAKAYFEKHIDEKFESYKAELQKDMDTHKSQLEKERTEDAKKFENKFKTFTSYMDDRYSKIKELRDLIASRYLAVIETDSADIPPGTPVENEIIRYLEGNLMYFEDDFEVSTRQIVSKLRMATISKHKSYIIQSDEGYAGSEQQEQELKKMYYAYEKFLGEKYSAIF